MQETAGFTKTLLAAVRANSVVVTIENAVSPSTGMDPTPQADMLLALGGVIMLIKVNRGHSSREGPSSITHIEQHSPLGAVKLYHQNLF